MNETVGQRIQRLRQQRGWTQKHLADLVGVSTRAVGGWENDEHPPSKLAKLREVFGSAFTEDGTPAGDPVVAAIERSRLTEDRQHTVIGAYKRELREQDYEDERRRLA